MDTISVARTTQLSQMVFSYYYASVGPGPGADA
jgi:hypothetical protein